MIPLKRTTPFVLAILALSLLAPTVQAAEPPEAQPWNPATAQTSVLDFGMSRDGNVLVVGLAAAQANPAPGGQQNPASPDLSVLDFATGAVWNRSCAEQQGLNTPTCRDRSHVALDGDGDVLAVGEPTGRLEVRVRDGATYPIASNWPKASVDPSGTAQDPRPVQALAVSDDGALIAVTTGSAHGNAMLTVYHRNGEQQWRFPADAPSGAATANHVGLLTSLAFSDDGRWLAAAGTVVQGNTTKGVVYLFDTTAGAPNPGGVFVPSPVTALAMNPSGSYLAAGSEDGTVRALARSGTGIFSGAALNLTAPVNGITIGDAASVPPVAVAHGGGVTYLERDPATADLRVRWTSELSGGANDVDLAPAGDLVAVASPAGAMGFAAHDPAPLYTLDGARTHAAVGPGGARVAFASTTEVTAFTHNPAATIVHVDATGTVLETPPVPQANAGSPAVFHLAIVNNGTLADNGHLVLPQTGDADVTANKTTYATRPGSRALVRVQVNPANVVPGEYNFTFRTVSGITGETTSIDLRYTVGAVTGVTLAYTGETDFVAEPGDEISLQLSVHNVGNRGTNFTLVPTQDPSTGADWPVTVLPSSENYTFLARSAASPATITVTVPQVPDGTTNDVRIVAVTDDGAQSSPIDLSVVVNPHYAANLTLNANEGPTRLVSAGNAAWYNLTLTNTGSVEATYVLTWDVTSTDPTRIWNQDVQGLDDWGRVVLGPGGSAPITIRLHAPQNARVADAATIHLHVKDFNPEPVRPLLQEWLNLTARVQASDNVVTEKPPSNVLFTPGADLFAALAAIATTATLLARRRAQ